MNEKFGRFSLRLLHELAIIAILAGLGLAIRLPYFFPAVINWDESTFIVVGQSTADGFLPNEAAWDSKPPFVFWWFGAAMELFGRSIPSIRFAGFLWLLLSGYCIFRAALWMTDSKLGSLFAAGLFMVTSSVFALYVSTEHLAALPMAAALLVLINSRKMRSIFLGGMLLGIACAFRLNLVYLCLVIGVFLSSRGPYLPTKNFLDRALKKTTWFSLGVLLPTLFGFLLYLLGGRSQIWLTTYEAASSYSAEQRSIANVVTTLERSLTGFVGAMMWGTAILGAFTLTRGWRDLSHEQRSNWLMCGAFVLGSFLSVVMTGPSPGLVAYSHYFVQLVPGLSMFSAAIFMPPSKATNLQRAEVAKFAFGVALIAFAIFRTTAGEWSRLSQRLSTGAGLSYGVEYEIADFIRRQGIKDYSLFMVSNNIVYWLLDRYPPTLLATYPSNLGKPYLRRYLEPDSATTKDALRSVFLRNPTFVVLPPAPGPWYLDEGATQFMQQELATSFELVSRIEGHQVFRRKPSAASIVPDRARL